MNPPETQNNFDKISVKKKKKKLAKLRNIHIKQHLRLVNWLFEYYVEKIIDI